MVKFLTILSIFFSYKYCVYGKAIVYEPYSSAFKNGISNFHEEKLNVQCPKYGQTSLTLIPHPTDCQKYFSCDFDVPLEKKCGNGLHFDVKLKVCNYPEQANCQFHSRGNIFPEEQNSKGNKKIESSFENSITEISKTTKPATTTITITTATTTTTSTKLSLSTISTETTEEYNVQQLPDYDDSEDSEEFDVYDTFEVKHGSSSGNEGENDLEQQKSRGNKKIGSTLENSIPEVIKSTKLTTSTTTTQKITTETTTPATTTTTTIPTTTEIEVDYYATTTDLQDTDFSTTEAVENETTSYPKDIMETESFERTSISNDQTYEETTLSMTIEDEYELTTTTEDTDIQAQTADASIDMTIEFITEQIQTKTKIEEDKHKIAKY